MITLTAFFGIFLTATQIIPNMGPSQHGRSGNNHLEKEQYEEAASAYQKGLESLESPLEADQTYYGLQNNLGLTLHRQENYQEASLAFERALSSAPSNDASAWAAFNAGNNAFDNQLLEQALSHYQTALMENPDNEDAKFNFEFVSRQLQKQQQESDGDDQQESDGDDQQESDGDNQQESDGNDQQESDGNDQQESDGDQEQNSSEQQQPQDESSEPSDQSATPLTREQAERILEALENEEEELLREVQKIEGRPRRVTKDW